ncbi:MAG: NAD-dependent epimerase/dehydratase family protein, partial [Deltaproteobacteria bacterium]
RRENHDATVALARAARDAGVGAFVFVSSIAAMGFASGPVRRDGPCAPVTAYGRAKLEAERAVLGIDGPRVVVLRPPTVYGPGERYNFLALTQSVARGVFRVIGSGWNVMPLCTRENVARACVAGAEGSVPAGIHHVADDARYSMNRVHRAITAALGVGHPRVHLPVPLALAAGLANEAVSYIGAPLVLSRARVRTLTADQPFDVASLRDAGVALDARLESEVVRTVEDYRRAGLVAR